MPPQLVIANAPFRLFPNGVIALRASDWVGPARGTLSTEIDSVASTGTCVRDTQQVAPSGSLLDDVTPYSAADDTLVIPYADIPVVDEEYYRIYVIARVDGEWDITNGAVLRKSSNLIFTDVSAIGSHGTSTETETNGNAFITKRFIAQSPHYTMVETYASEINKANDVLRVRAYTANGMDAEVCIDQIILLPDGGVGSPIPPIVTLDGGIAQQDLADGGDGGDDNGKFTYYRQNLVDNWDSGAPNASADYQKKSSAEDAQYTGQIFSSDGFTLQTTGPTEIKASMYTANNVRWKEFDTIDDFSNRTTSGRDMGVSSGGYGYRIGFGGQANNPEAFVAGGVGVMRINQGGGLIQVEFGSSVQGIAAVSNQGARIESQDMATFSGVVEHVAGALNGERWTVYLDMAGTGWLQMIRISPLAKTWVFGYTTGTGFVQVTGPHSIPWYSPGVPLGFKIEQKRYLIRMRLWDASGAEPSTWGYEDFRHIEQSETMIAYPYSDDLVRSQLGYTKIEGFGFTIEDTGVGGPDTVPYTVNLSDWRVQIEPYGDSEDMDMYMEAVNGTQIGEITIPYGAPHFVFWGSRDWTELFSSNYRLEFAHKMWNPLTSAEIQRAELFFTWHRGFFGGPIDLSKLRFRSFESDNV